MRTPKRWIPPLAVAALPLTGTACSGGDSPEVTLLKSLDAFCVYVGGCYPDYDVDACREYVREDVNELSQEYSGACLEAFASYINCVSSLTCEEYMDPDSPEFEACEEFFETVVGPACDSMPTP